MAGKEPKDFHDNWTDEDLLWKNVIRLLCFWFSRYNGVLILIPKNWIFPFSITKRKEIY